jgi:hypothetical protein
VPLFALAAFLAARAWFPLEHGYFSTPPDSPPGIYLTVALTALSVAALFAAAGAAILSGWFRRHGGFLVVAGLAVLASVLPYVLFKWTGDSDTWPWAYFVEHGIASLRFEPRPRSYGIAIQIGLAATAAASVAAQFWAWRSAGSPSGAVTDGARLTHG